MFEICSVGEFSFQEQSLYDRRPVLEVSLRDPPAWHRQPRPLVPPPRPAPAPTGCSCHFTSEDIHSPETTPDAHLECSDSTVILQPEVYATANH
jgi:hypothetical protein